MIRPIPSFQILRREFENEALQTGKPRLLLTAAVAAGDAATTAYEISKISQYVFVDCDMFTIHSKLNALSIILFILFLYEKVRRMW